MSTDPAGTDDPLSEAEIQQLRQEIDSLDAQILASVKRRAEVSRLIGKTRMASGGTRLVHTRELKVYERFSELGEEGRMLASLLLRLGRGRLAAQLAVDRLQLGEAAAVEDQRQRPEELLDLDVAVGAVEGDPRVREALVQRYHGGDLLLAAPLSLKSLKPSRWWVASARRTTASGVIASSRRTRSQSSAPLGARR